MAAPKRKYIEAAYELLRREGLDGVSIRKVATEAGCSSAALYKHFSDVDELIAIASIRYLHDYTEDARTLATVDLNPLELNLQLWECLAYYSFNDAPIFENLFFGANSGEISGRLTAEYYENFPEELEDQKGFMQDMFAGSSMFERDSILLARAEGLGMLSKKSAEYLCKVDTYLYRGMLASIRDTYRDPEVARRTTREFMKLIIEGYRSHLERGYSILVVEPEVPKLTIDTKMDKPRAYQVVIPMNAKAKARHKRSTG